MRMRNDILVATVFCVATGCGRQHGDPGLVAEKRDSAAQKLEMPVVEKRNAAVQKASTPLFIGVTGGNLDAKYGMPIRLDITVCNRASQAIWIDESWLPWSFRRSVRVRVETRVPDRAWGRLCGAASVEKAGTWRTTRGTHRPERLAQREQAAFNYAARAGWSRHEPARQ